MNDAKARDRWFDAGGVRLRYSVDGEGPVIILVHSFLLDAMSWRSRGCGGRARVVATRW